MRSMFLQLRKDEHKPIQAAVPGKQHARKRSNNSGRKKEQSGAQPGAQSRPLLKRVRRLIQTPAEQSAAAAADDGDHLEDSDCEIGAPAAAAAAGQSLGSRQPAHSSSSRDDDIDTLLDQWMSCQEDAAAAAVAAAAEAASTNATGIDASQLDLAIVLMFMIATARAPDHALKQMKPAGLVSCWVVDPSKKWHYISV